MSTRTTRPLTQVRLCLAFASSLFFSGVVLLAQAPAPTSIDTKRVDAAVSGGALQGQGIFRGKGTCENCHRVHGRGSRLGPDLSDIGLQRPLEELRRSILDPNAEILPRNRFYRVVTRDGETITGRLLNHDTFTVQLMTPKEELVRFRKSDLREHGFQKNSRMPPFEGKLAPEELADLIAYLASLKGISQ
jgi:putative heme-binding domain-containing protein